MPKKTAAFRSASRYYDNRANKTDQNHPDWKVLMDFTPDQAVKAAEWFMAMADDCQVNQRKIRKYERDGVTYEEVSGFTTSIAFWQNDIREGDPTNEDGTAKYPKFSGSFSPLPPEQPVAQEPACPMPEPQRQEQCPMPTPEKQPVAAGWN